jgi:hypothetical protein
MCYEKIHGRTPKVSQFYVFGCKCFILKKAKNLDKLEAWSVDGIFFGYAIHSRAFRVLNLESNQIVETCEVTFEGPFMRQGRGWSEWEPIKILPEG